MNRNLLAVIAIVALLACGALLLWTVGDRAAEDAESLAESVRSASPQLPEPSPPDAEAHAQPD